MMSRTGPDRTGPARDRAEPVAQLLRVLVRLRADIARKDRPFGRVVADALCQMMRSQRLRVACPFFCVPVEQSDKALGRFLRHRPRGLSGFPCAGGGLNITPRWLL
jgi:hypothetical protein